MSLKDLVAKSESRRTIPQPKFAGPAQPGCTFCGRGSYSFMLNYNALLCVCVFSGILDDILGPIFKLGEWRVSVYVCVNAAKKYVEYANMFQHSRKKWVLSI